MVKTYGDLYQDTRRALARQAPPQDPGVLARLLVCQASGKTQAQFLADRDLYAEEKIVAEVEEIFAACWRMSPLPMCWVSGNSTAFPCWCLPRC